MKFRPCIDIHNGKVKQIVGGSLLDAGDYASENFVSEKDSAYYASLFKEDGLKGAHVILLNGKDSNYYQATREEALNALKAFPGGMQIGGGVNAVNAKSYIEAGASHVIVTSYAFKDGAILFDNLKALRYAVGADHVVLDLSARALNGDYYVVTDRWQKFTNMRVTPAVFEHLSEYCDEFLVHGVDVEGKRHGVDESLIHILGDAARAGNKAITYAGGITTLDDIDLIEKITDGRINFTVGSALDLYGGNIEYKYLAKRYN